MSSNPYDILIVGAGVAGSALAYALAMGTSKKHIAPLRIALLERSLSKPDRIVAELLQPGGVAALEKLGIESCLDEIGALPSSGYNLVRGEQVMCASFPGGKEGRTFDHGSFVMALRDRVRGVPNVVMIEATVTELIEDQGARRVIGVRASQAGGQLESHFADLVVLSDGSHSKFRTALLGLSCEPTPQGYFAGFIVKDLELPQSKYATCAALKGTRPVIIYGLPDNKYRVLVGLKNPPPADVKVCNLAWLRDHPHRFCRNIYCAMLFLSFIHRYARPFSMLWMQCAYVGSHTFIFHPRNRERVPRRVHFCWEMH